MAWKRLEKLTDSFVSAIAPGRALQRFQARTGLRIMAATRGGLASEHTDGLPEVDQEAHPDNDIIPDSGKQRRRCTLAYYNNAITRGIVDSQTRQVLGSITVHANTGDAATDQLIEGEFYRAFDAGLHEPLRQCFAHTLIDGGAVPLPLGKPSDPLELEVIPYRRIKTPFRLVNGAIIRDGFEYDATVRKLIAAHVEREESSYDAVFANGETDRVPLFSHPCLPRLAGQTKGLSWYTAGIYRLEMVDRWMNALLASAELHAYVVALIRTGGKDARGVASSMAAPLDPESTKKLNKFAREHRFMFLPDGGDYQLVQANAPQIADFLMWNLRFVARALGVSYERLTYDLSKTSFSSTKFGDRDDRITVLEHQRIAHRAILTPCAARLCQSLALNGKLPAPALYAADPQAFVNSIYFQLPGRPPVDELKAENANEVALKNRTASRTRIAASQGLDAEEIEKEIIREDKRFFQAREAMYLELGFPAESAREYALEDLRQEQKASAAPVPADNGQDQTNQDQTQQNQDEGAAA